MYWSNSNPGWNWSAVSLWSRWIKPQNPIQKFHCTYSMNKIMAKQHFYTFQILMTSLSAARMDPAPGSTWLVQKMPRNPMIWMTGFAAKPAEWGATTFTANVTQGEVTRIKWCNVMHKSNAGMMNGITSPAWTWMWACWYHNTLSHKCPAAPALQNS